MALQPKAVIGTEPGSENVSWKVHHRFLLVFREVEEDIEKLNLRGTYSGDAFRRALAAIVIALCTLNECFVRY